MSKPSKSPKSFGLLSLVGWFLSATSVLNLVNDIGRVAIFGKLKAWVDAYSMFVNKTGNFLFGWINLGWVSVSSSEYHILVITALLCMAVFRAELANKIEDIPWRIQLFFAVFISSLHFFGILIIVLVLPGNYGFWISILWLLAVVTITLRETDLPDWPFLSGQVVRRELYGVVAVFAVLLAANYSVFRSDGG